MSDGNGVSDVRRVIMSVCTALFPIGCTYISRLLICQPVAESRCYKPCTMRLSRISASQRVGFFVLNNGVRAIVCACVWACVLDVRLSFM